MSEIDLIPKNYREHIWKINTLKLFGVIVLCLIITAGVAYAALEYVKQETISEINKLSEIKEITSQQREMLQKLRSEKKELDYQWSLLNGLRSAFAAEDLFVAIDDAIQNVDVWFSSIKFERSEIALENENTVNTGYFIIVTPDEEKKSLAIGTKMLITGEALNHSTLSSFVKSLIDQPEILDAKVLETSLNRNKRSKYVKFHLAITVNLENKMS